MLSDTMTEADLQKLTNELALLSPYSVREFYRERLEACRLQPGTDKLPAPQIIQQLVVAWKLLRKWQA